MYVSNNLQLHYIHVITFNTFIMHSGAKKKLKQGCFLGCPHPIPSYKLCLFGQTCLGMSCQRKFIFRAKLLLFWVASQYNILYQFLHRFTEFWQDKETMWLCCMACCVCLHVIGSWVLCPLAWHVHGFLRCFKCHWSQVTSVIVVSKQILISLISQSLSLSTSGSLTSLFIYIYIYIYMSFITGQAYQHTSILSGQP